jgi:hypothetical protein
MSLMIGLIAAPFSPTRAGDIVVPRAPTIQAGNDLEEARHTAQPRGYNRDRHDKHNGDPVPSFQGGSTRANDACSC